MIFSPSLFLPSFLLLFLSATATYRGQILFKDTLAQQLCEQGGEYQGCCMHTSLCKHMHNECVGSYRHIFYMLHVHQLICIMLLCVSLPTTVCQIVCILSKYGKAVDALLLHDCAIAALPGFLSA